MRDQWFPKWRRGHLFPVTAETARQSVGHDRPRVCIVSKATDLVGLDPDRQARLTEFAGRHEIPHRVDQWLE